MADFKSPVEPQSQPAIQPDPEEDLHISNDADVDMAELKRPHGMGMGMDGTADGDEAEGAAAAAGTAADGVPEVPRPAEPKMPSRKDAGLREFMEKMDEYAPIVCIYTHTHIYMHMHISFFPFSSLLSLVPWKLRINSETRHTQIPDAVTNYYLTKAGLPPPPQTPVRLARLLALATQKFIADIATDAYQYSRIRSSNTSSNNPMGSLGAAAGFPVPGQGGLGAAGAGAGGAGVGQAGKEGGGGGGQQHTKGGHVLGVQRPGFGGGGQGGGHGRSVLMMEDLGMAVGEYGVNLKRGEFYR